MARKRIDPKSTAADGRRNYDHLVNRRPDRHYVAVNPNDEMALSEYQAKGYDYERTGSPDAVRAAVGRVSKDGEIVTVLGQLVMSCSIEDWKANFASGQGIADEFDRATKRGHLEGETRGRGYAIGVDPSSRSFVETETSGA